MPSPWTANIIAHMLLRELEMSRVPSRQASDSSIKAMLTKARRSSSSDTTTPIPCSPNLVYMNGIPSDTFRIHAQPNRRPRRRLGDRSPRRGWRWSQIILLPSRLSDLPKHSAAFNIDKCLHPPETSPGDHHREAQSRSGATRSPVRGPPTQLVRPLEEFTQSE